MAIFVKKPDNTWGGFNGLSARPWIKRPDNTWVLADKVYRKRNDNSAWDEVWPRLPNAPTNLAISMPYRNDRIEMDLSWTAPVGGVAVAYYIVSVTFNQVPYNSYQVNAPTAALTLTDGDGFQDKAGQNASFTVRAFTAENVQNQFVGSQGAVVPQLPAPPAVTSLSASISAGNVSYSFSHGGGNRVTNYEVTVQYRSVANGNPTSGVYYFPSKNGVTSGSSSPVAGANVNGGLYTILVRAYGPGGSASTVSVTVANPADLRISPSPRFSGGVLTVGIGQDAQNFSWASNIFLTTNDANFAYVGSLGGPGTFNVPGSSGWARDNSTYYKLFVQPVDSGTGFTGRLLGVPGFSRKMSMPFRFNAQDSATWNNGAWQGDSGGNYVFQGNATGVGFYYGYAFYGNIINQYLGPGYVGYNLGFTDFYVWCGRDGVGAAPYYSNYAGPNAPVFIGFGLHTAADRNGHTEVFSGVGSATDGSTSYAYDDVHYARLPAVWAYYLANQTNGWRGLGIFSPDQTIQYLPPNGTSNSMARMYGHGRGASGVNFWTIDIYHDG